MLTGIRPRSTSFNVSWAIDIERGIPAFTQPLSWRVECRIEKGERAKKAKGKVKASFISFILTNVHVALCLFALLGWFHDGLALPFPQWPCQSFFHMRLGYKLLLAKVALENIEFLKVLDIKLLDRDTRRVFKRLVEQFCRNGVLRVDSESLVEDAGGLVGLVEIQKDETLGAEDGGVLAALPQNLIELSQRFLKPSLTP